MSRELPAKPNLDHLKKQAKELLNDIPALGRDRTPHQVARDFGHEDVFEFLMQHSPEDLKLSQACQLGDENLFRAMLANRPNLARTLSDQERRRSLTPRKTTILMLYDLCSQPGGRLTLAANTR